MRIHLLAAGALFGALTTIGFSQTAAQVQTLGAADQSALTHFNVYLPLILGVVGPGPIRSVRVCICLGLQAQLVLAH